MTENGTGTRNPQLLKGVLPMLVLVLLDEQDSYGYELVTRLQRAGLAGVSGGSVYPVLTRLERDAHLTSYLVQSSAGPVRKYYSTTPSGLGLLNRHRESWTELTGVVEAVVGPPAVPDAAATTRTDTTETTDNEEVLK